VMPSKDDDDPASTKDVVTKRQKQLLNREEMDLNLIAESLGGVLLEAPNLKSVGSSIFRTVFGNQSGRTKKGSKTVRTGRPPGVGLRQRGAKDRSVTSSGGGSDRGSVGNAASQRQVNPGQTAYKAKSTSTKIPSASGGDAGSAARARLVAPRPSGASVLRSLKGIRGNVQTTALNVATAGALDKLFVEPVGNYLGTQLAKGLMTATGTQQLYPNMFGKQGPALDVKTLRAIKARQKKAAQAQAEAEPETATSKETEVATQTDVKKDSTNKVKLGQQTKDKPTPVSPQAVAAPTIAGVLRGTRTGRGRRPSEPKKPGKTGKFKISPPGYGGKIGRRSNPQ